MSKTGKKTKGAPSAKRKRGPGAGDYSKGLRKYTSIVVKAALAEDVGSGDITTGAVVPRTLRGRAVILAKEDLVLAGLHVAEEVFRSVDRKIVFRAKAADGERLRKGAVIAEVEGRLAPILTGERVALNFLQRLSGIATLTSEFVRRAGAGVKILDTRKTTPCLRMLERHAVKCGGGHNHRRGLYDYILIKDNHIRAAGSVAEAIGRVEKKYGGAVAVEVEAATVAEAREAAECGADIIMLDNMDASTIRKALKAIDGRALVEVSGGVTLGSVARYARTGVDFISVGSLTHSARSVDISLEVA